MIELLNRHKLLLFFIVLIPSYIFFIYYVENKREKEWADFFEKHECASIGRQQFGVGKSSFIQTGYKCDDGITYWR